MDHNCLNLSLATIRKQLASGKLFPLSWQFCAEQISLNLSRDGRSMGTVVINVFKEPPLGTQRFLQLAQRNAGGYRLSRVDGVSNVRAPDSVMQHRSCPLAAFGSSSLLLLNSLP